MPRTLREVLDEFAVKHHGRIEEIRAIRDEWVEAVRELLAQCRRWLEETDKDKLLRIDEFDKEVGEEELGRYEAPAMVVRLGNREVSIEPQMRMTSLPRSLKHLGEGHGVVSLENDSHRRFSCYRLKEEQGNRWIILHPLTPPWERSAEPLTRESFDLLVAHLLG